MAVASAYALLVAVLGELFAPAIIRVFRDDPAVISLAFGLDGIIAAQPISDLLSFLLAIPLCHRSLSRLGRR